MVVPYFTVVLVVVVFGVVVVTKERKSPLGVPNLVMIKTKQVLGEVCGVDILGGASCWGRGRSMLGLGGMRLGISGGSWFCS